MRTISRILSTVAFATLGAAGAGAQTHILSGDIVRFNAGPCAITSVDGSPDKIVLSQCPVLTTAAATNLTLTPTGDLITDPQGKDILPAVGYDIKIGAPTKQYLSLDVAELHAQTLVAQDVIATIGGIIDVAPTTQLVADLSSGATTIHVKHNEMVSGDRAFLKSAPGGIAQYEMLVITSGPTGSAGDYAYTVTRNFDGSGANNWSAGDAVLNTGTIGDGLIELYSTGGTFGGSGPSIVGSVRTGTGATAIAPRWAIGNLNGLFNYGATTYGAAFGDASATNVTIDAANGFRIRSGTTNKLSADTSGNLSLTGDLILGSASVMHSSSATSLTTGDGFYMSGGATPTFRIGNPAGNRFVYDSGSGTAAFFGDASGATNLNVGAGRNMVRNADCTVSTADWTFGTGSGLTFSLGTSFSAGWMLNGDPGVCYLKSDLTPTSGTMSVAYLAAPFPVIAGHRYEASAYLGVVRSGNTQAVLQWLDGAGSLISNTVGNTCTSASAGSTFLADYCRSGVVATAPVGTGTARLVIQTTHNGSSSPFVFFVHTYFGEALTGQSDLTPWGPAGATEIIGGLIRTGTIVAGNIAAGTITATQIAAGTITASNIASGTITASQIASGTITASQIASGTITATQIAAGTITASNIASGTITATQIASGSITATQINTSTLTALGSVTAGTFNLGSGNFQVNSFGIMTAASATFNDGVIFNLTGPSVIRIPSFGGGGTQRVCVDNLGQLGAGGC